MRDKTKTWLRVRWCAKPSTQGGEFTHSLSLSHARSINNATALWGELCNQRGAGKQEEHGERAEGAAAADWGFSRQDKLVPDPQLNKIHP